MKNFTEQDKYNGETPARDNSGEALFDPDFGEMSLGESVQEIFKPGDDIWFAYVDVRSIYNRYGDLIGYVDSDGVTLRSLSNSEAIAHQVGGIFYTPEGDVWGITSTAPTADATERVQSESESDDELICCH